MIFSVLTRPSRSHVAIAAVVGLLATSSGLRADDAERSPFAGLSGSWVGDGSVTMSNGSRERIRCRATYSVMPQGRSLNQGLRCASDSYTFDVRSNVTANAGGALTGTWSEATRQVTGDVTGNATPGHIQTSVETFGFSAQLSITTRGARQSVSMQPEGTEVQAVNIEMRRI